MKKDELIKSWMSNYPESGSENSLKAIVFDYETMIFRFVDIETKEQFYVNMKKLRAGV